MRQIPNKTNYNIDFQAIEGQEVTGVFLLCCANIMFVQHNIFER